MQWRLRSGALPHKVPAGGPTSPETLVSSIEHAPQCWPAWAGVKRPTSPVRQEQAGQVQTVLRHEVVSALPLHTNKTPRVIHAFAPISRSLNAAS